MKTLTIVLYVLMFIVLIAYIGIRLYFKHKSNKVEKALKDNDIDLSLLQDLLDGKDIQ